MIVDCFQVILFYYFNHGLLKEYGQDTRKPRKNNVEADFQFWISSMHFNLFRCVFLQMKGQLIAISKIEKYFFQFWVFWAKIDNAQNDPKMGNFHGTRTRVLKDTRFRIIWQVNAFEIYFVHLHYYLNLSKYILSCVKSSNPTFGPENSPKWPKNTLK